MLAQYDFTKLESSRHPLAVSYAGKPLARVHVGGIRPKFKLGDYVIKLDDGATNPQSTVEAHIYNNIIAPEDKKFFAPVLFHSPQIEERSPGFIVQDWLKLASLGYSYSDVYSQAKKTVEKLCKQYGIDDVLYNSQNWAILAETNEPIILDYGLGIHNDEIIEVLSSENSLGRISSESWSSSGLSRFSESEQIEDSERVSIF